MGVFSDLLIKFNRMTYFQSHDGYPNDVIPELKIEVARAKEIVLNSEKKNCSFIGALEALLTENEKYTCSAVDCFPAEYAFEIVEQGNICQVGI